MADVRAQVLPLATGNDKSRKNANPLPGMDSGVARDADFQENRTGKDDLIYTFINPAMENGNSGSVSAIETLSVSHYLGHQSRNTIQRCTGEG